MVVTKHLKSILCIGFALLGTVQSHAELVAGPLYSDFPLTLESGRRTEAVGPFFYSQQVESEHLIAFPPFYSRAHDDTLELTETDYCYPFLTYRRYAGEYRFQLVQLISWSGGRSQKEDSNHRFTLFPFYFQQRNPDDPSKNYTAVVPFYGHLENRLFRDDIKFVMFPIYSQTRKKDVITDNYFYPIYHKRYGGGVTGWQVWPIVGKETKEITYRTNQIDEVETNGGHQKFFAAWPFYFHDFTGIGTTNEAESRTLVPFYSCLESTSRDSVSYGWPFGYTKIDDRENRYKQTQFLYPLFVKARGEGKYTTRVFPFYSHAATTNKESDWYMWPVVKINRLHADPLERSRTRILFFLYSDTSEKNTQTGESMRRVEFWPLFSKRREMNGDERLQILSVVEPFFPNNKSVPRNYAPIYSFWRSESNAKTGAKSQSLFWNLYRREQTPASKKCSVLFGLFQYETRPEGKKWRVCYFPIEKTADSAKAK